MRAIVFDTPGELSLVEIPDPMPKPGEAVIQVDAAGLCGTDIHTFHGSYPAPFPFVPGHEFAGTVIEVGAGVDSGMIGRRYAVHPIAPCGRCSACRAGRLNFCAKMDVYGGNLTGGFAERSAIKVTCLHELSDDLPCEIAAFAEPLACVLHGLNRVGVEAGDRVLLFGAGSIGLLLLQACKVMGAATVDVIDLIPSKLDIARGLGGSPLAVGSTPDMQAYDLVIDATGVPKVVASMPAFARSGGRVLYFGVCPPGVKIEIEPFEIFRREISIVGCFSLAYEIGSALRLLASRAVDAAPLISARRPLSEMRDAIADHDRGGTAIKTLFIPSL